MRRILVASVILSVLAPGLHAQGLTDEELLDIMQRQRTALEESSTTGTTRGLSIVTSAPEQGSAAASQDTGEAGLKSLANMKQGTVVRFEDDLEINIQVKFEFDSATIEASERPALDQMCRVMSKAENIEKFRIIGHTDSSGSDIYNKRLSQLRAEEVGRHLVNNCGISAARLELVGYGEEFPDNADDPGAPENRRVEFQALS